MIDRLLAASQDRLIRHLAAVAVFLNRNETETETETEDEISLGLTLYHMPLETYARRAVFAAVRRLAASRPAFVVARVNGLAIIYTLKNVVYAKVPRAWEPPKA